MEMNYSSWTTWIDRSLKSISHPLYSPHFIVLAIYGRSVANGFKNLVSASQPLLFDLKSRHLTFDRR